MSGSGDYISREAANEACREAVRRCPNSFYNGIEAARDAIRKLPAADVRPVVTCDECKCYGGRERAGYTEGFCKRSDLCVGAFDFCSRGEKREES